MRTRAILAVAILATTILAGCTLARQVTTKHLDFTQNIIPERNNGVVYNPGLSDTNGPIGPQRYNIVITGEVKDKYDRYHGGVDYAFFTYRVENKASAPIRLRLWAAVASTCPPIVNAEVPSEARLMLDVNVPAHDTITFTRDKGVNVEPLRQIVQRVLERSDNAGACIYVQADCADFNGTFIIHDLTVVGRARGSLF